MIGTATMRTIAKTIPKTVIPTTENNQKHYYYHYK